MAALDALETELSEATDQARTLVDSTDGRLFTVRPNPQSWSAAECIAHLSISTELFLPALREAIDDARRRNVAANGEPSMDLLGRILRWFLEPPIRQRVKTRAPFVPKSTRAKAEAFGEFSAGQAKLLDLLREARSLDLKKIKIVSPFDKRVRFNLYSAFRIVAAHQRRHLWQASRAIEALKPSAALAGTR